MPERLTLAVSPQTWTRTLRALGALWLIGYSCLTPSRVAVLLATDCPDWVTL